MTPPSPVPVDPRAGSSAIPPGTRIGGHYRVLDPLGRAGGFGRTYRALDETLHREVAIKEYFPRDLVARLPRELRLVPHSPAEASPFEFGKARFLEEGRTLAGLEHPHVIRVLELFEQHATAYLVMEYHRGATLADLAAADGGALPVPVVTALASGALAGLAAVHAAGVVHCDVKPSNLYVTESGRVLLLDFGAARRDLGERTATLDGVVSPGFAPFELFQERGRVGPWTDVYGVAATAVALLTGERPPSAADRLEHDLLAPEGALASRLPGSLRAPLLAALALRPEHRTATATALDAALTAVPAVSPAELGARVRAIATTREAASDESGSSTTTIDGEVRSRRSDRGRAARIGWAAAALAVATAATLYLTRDRSEPAPLASPVPQPAAAAPSEPLRVAEPAAATVELLLDVRPYGELVALRSPDGESLRGAESISLPARVRIPAGEWVAVVRPPAGGGTVEIPVRAVAGATARIERRFAPLPARAYFESSGW
jgi:hypothetical protein